MKFFRLLAYDYKNGFRVGTVKLLVMVLFVVAFCIDFYYRKYVTYSFDEVIPSGTFIDYLFSIFAGIKEYTPSREENFIIPVKWLLLHLFICYSTLYYPSRDLSSMGLNILVRTKGRLTWWFSKCIWNVSYVLTMYGVILITVFAFCLITKEPISLNITRMFVTDLLQPGDIHETLSFNLVYIILFYPLLILIGLNLLQMTLVLIFKPLYSFVVVTVIWLTSAYLFSPFLPGNYAMVIRSEYVIQKGLSASGGMVMFLFLVSVSLIFGSLYFRRYDVLGEE